MDDGVSFYILQPFYRQWRSTTLKKDWIMYIGNPYFEFFFLVQMLQLKIKSSSYSFYQQYYHIQTRSKVPTKYATLVFVYFSKKLQFTMPLDDMYKSAVKNRKTETCPSRFISNRNFFQKSLRTRRPNKRRIANMFTVDGKKSVRNFKLNLWICLTKWCMRGRLRSRVKTISLN